MSDNLSSRNLSLPKAPTLLRWFLPEALQEAVIGDLHEELSRGPRSTSVSARVWYWRQILGIAGHFAKDTIARWRFGFSSGSGAKSAPSEPSESVSRSKAKRFTTAAQNVGQDLRFALRQLRKNPSFAIVAVLALALGIATNATIFSLVNAVLLRPLPYADADRIVLFRAHILPAAPQLGTSGPELALFREQCASFDEIAAYTWASVNLTQSGEPEELQGGVISANFFQMFGVPALMGTAILPDADKGEDTQVAVLSYGLWQRRFGGDPGILRKSILIDGQSRTVIGVMPAAFKVLQTSATSPNDVDVWLPQPIGYKRLPVLDHNLQIIAKRKAGVTVAQVQAEINAASEEVKKRYFSFAKFAFGVDVVSLYGEVVKRVRPALLVLLGAVAFVLLIACVNVANLLLAKAVSREREIAIRTTLGASRSRLVSQLMTESLALALCGGLVGLLLAVFGLRALVAIAPDNIPRLSEISLDGRVLFFTIVTAILTGLGFGLVPAFQLSKPGLSETMNDGNKSMTGGTRSMWLRKALLVSEVALALISLTGAGLMIRSFLRLQVVNPGFQPSNLLTAELSLSSQKYDDSRQAGFFYQRALERIGGLPGVQSAGAVSILPLTGKNSLEVIAIEGPTGSRSMNAFQSQYRTVTPDYFSTMKIPLIAGRYFSEQDGADNQNVAIVNEDCAKRLWPGQNPLGRRINLATDVHRNKPWAIIVGVVGETKDAGLDTKDAFQIFMANAQRPQRKMSIVVRTSGDPLQAAAALRAAVWSLDPEQPIAAIRAMDQILYLSVAQPRFNAILLGVFAALATLLGSIGIYGLMSYSVSQRTQEIGIRIALGAQRRDVARMVVGQSLRLVLIGVAIGLLGAFAATRLMSTLLFGVTPTDAATFMVVPVLIIGVAALASYLPVRRATRVDPLVALRYE